MKLSDDYSYAVDKLLKSKILTDKVLKNTELAREYANNAERAIKNCEILSKYFPADPIRDKELLLGVEPEELRGIIRGIPEVMRTVKEIKEGIKKLREKKELQKKELHRKEIAIKSEVLEKEFENLSKKQRERDYVRDPERVRLPIIRTGYFERLLFMIWQRYSIPLILPDR